jgi:hypothetical protein
MSGATLYARRARLGTIVRKQVWSPHSPEAVALKVCEQPFGDRDGLGLVGGDDEVGAACDDGVTGKPAALDDGDPRHQARQFGLQLEGAGIQR